MKLDFAVGTNRDERMDEIAGHARVAEESGFRFVTFVDQPFMSRDVFASMTIAAQNTNRIHFGPGVFDLTTHHPLAIAGGIASIDELSGGRTIVGIGAGGAFGGTMKPRSVKEVRNAVEFIRRFTGGEEVETGGQRMRCEFCRRQVPVYVAASGPRMLEMAGEEACHMGIRSADGWGERSMDCPLTETTHARSVDRPTVRPSDRPAMVPDREPPRNPADARPRSRIGGTLGPGERAPHSAISSAARRGTWRAGASLLQSPSHRAAGGRTDSLGPLAEGLEEDNVMPVVRVSFYEGRSKEQKREIAEIITDALVRVAGSKREAVNVLFDNHAREDWVIGGAPEFAKSAQGD